MAPPDEPISPVITFGSVQDAVADRIRQMIRDGQLKPGDRLQQNELANTLGVSAMPVREALRQLQAEGLVVFYPRRGAIVAQISLAEYEEIFRMREELEILACRWAGEDFSRISLPRLSQILTDLEKVEAQHDVLRRLQLVRDFFFTIFEASQKDRLLRYLSSLWDLSQQYRRYFSLLTDTIPARMGYYRAIYQACEAQDTEALVTACRGLYAFVRDTLIPRLPEVEGEGQVD